VRTAIHCVKLKFVAALGDLARVLRLRDFRWLWFSQSASVVGDRIVLVAMALFVIGRTGSATDLGLVLAAQSLPLVGFIALGGVWADRLPRHRVMFVTDLARFILHALVAALIFLGSVEIWEFVVIEALFGTAEAFFRPAASGLVPQTVPEADIQQANALLTMSENVAEFVGPALATVLVIGAGAGAAFALDAATFLVSAACLTQVNPRRREVMSDSVAAVALAASGVWAEVREGFAEVRSRSWVWGTLAVFCVALFAGLAPWFVLGPIVAREQYGHTAVYGVVSAALGAGTIAGSVIGVNWRPRFPMRLAMIAMLVWPIASILFALGVTLAVVLPAVGFAGVGIALFNVWWLTALAERIPPDKLSRVTSYDWMVSLGLLPLGYVLAGPLSSTFGAVAVMVSGSAIAALAMAAGLLPRETRMLERTPGSPASADEHAQAS
jgi:MFS family permease